MLTLSPEIILKLKNYKNQLKCIFKNINSRGPGEFLSWIWEAFSWPLPLLWQVHHLPLKLLWRRRKWRGKKPQIPGLKAPLSYFPPLQLNVKWYAGVISIFPAFVVLNAVLTGMLPPWGFRWPENCLQLKRGWEGDEGEIPLFLCSS